MADRHPNALDVRKLFSSFQSVVHATVPGHYAKPKLLEGSGDRSIVAPNRTDITVEHEQAANGRVKRVRGHASVSGPPLELAPDNAVARVSLNQTQLLEGDGDQVRVEETGQRGADYWVMRSSLGTLELKPITTEGLPFNPSPFQENLAAEILDRVREVQPSFSTSVSRPLGEQPERGPQRPTGDSSSYTPSIP